MADEITKEMRERYAALVSQERALASGVESVAWDADANVLAGAMTLLAAVRAILAAFPEGVTPAATAPLLSDGDRQRIDWLLRDIEAARAGIRDISRDIPILESKLKVLPTECELGAWANVSGDPRELHYACIRQQLAAKRSEIAELQEGQRRNSEEVVRLEGRES